MKYSSMILFLLATGAVLPVIALGGDAPPDTALAKDFRTREAPYLHTREISTRPVQLTEIYGSMKGPQSTRGFQLHTDHESPYLWVRHLRVDTLNAQKELDSPEFLCHAWLTADMGDDGRSERRHPPLFLTISQGMEDMQFPDGFATMFDNRTIPRVSFLAMAVNNNYREIDKEVHFRATIDYLEDAAAKELGVKRLVPFMLHAEHEVTTVSGSKHHHAGHHDSEDQATPGQAETFDHWLVPPGEQVLRSAVLREAIPADGTAHFIKLHLHPYGRSVTLWDKTEDREVWSGQAENHPGKAFLTRTETYSSTTGLPIYKDHEYELITVYDNPTDHAIDAMAVLRLYVHAPALYGPNVYASEEAAR